VKNCALLMMVLGGCTEDLCEVDERWFMVGFREDAESSYRLLYDAFPNDTYGITPSKSVTLIGCGTVVHEFRAAKSDCVVDGVWTENFDDVGAYGSLVLTKKCPFTSEAGRFYALYTELNCSSYPGICRLP
jgi:hypothetical protein